MPPYATDLTGKIRQKTVMTAKLRSRIFRIPLQNAIRAFEGPREVASAFHPDHLI